MSSVASKFGSKLANIFSTDKKSSSSAQAHAAQSAAADLEASQERARRELLKMTKTARIGFPYRPTCVAYDPVQHLVAVGTRQGLVKLYGGESVEYTISHVGGGNNNSNGSTSTSQSFCSISMQSSASSSSSTTTTDSNNNNTNNGSPVLGASGGGAGGGGGAAAAYASLMSSSTNSPTTPAVLFMSFVVNEGALITYCDDSTISFWNLRQQQPGILFSRKLVNEKGTAMCLPFQSNWLFIGTEKGNVYLLNIYNNFSQSGYELKWNNLIELSQKTKPGKVIHLSEHPLEPSRILIGFDTGLIVLWNLKIRRAESHYYGISETMSSISWFYDGKQFMSAHNNGSLIVWSSKQGETKPLNILHPHMNESDLIPRYNMVRKVAWESTSKNGESLIIFSDGLPSNDCVMKDAITIIKNNKMKTIIEMKERIIDFIIVESSPWTSDNPTDPIGLIVLLENNLVVIDLRSEGFPQFQHHHPTGVHESPLTSTCYISDPNRSFFLALTTSRDKYLQEQRQQQQQLLQSRQQQQQAPAAVGSVTASKQVFSSLAYPINGGLRGTKSNVFGYPELLITGHEDGSVKFWDTSGLGLTLLHKFKTHKLFDKRKLPATSNDSVIEIDSPYKITSLACTKNYMAVAAAGGHVTLYKYYKKSSQEDGLADIPLFEIPIEYSSDSKSSSESNAAAHITTNLSSDFINKKELKCFLRTKIGFRRQEGFQPELVCLLYWSQRPPVVTNINIYTKMNLILFGTDESIIGVDYANRTLLVNVSTVDFYGPHDPFNRGHKSPKKNNKGGGGGNEADDNWADSPHSAAILAKQTTIDPSEKKIRKFGLTNLKNLIESSLGSTTTTTTTTHESGSDSRKDATMSRSSSCSSLENVAQSEGVSCIAIHDYAPTTITNVKSDYQQQIVQVWLGTTYGSVIVLNLINQGGSSSSSSGGGGTGSSSSSGVGSMSSSAAMAAGMIASSPTGVAGVSGSVPVERTVCPTGTVYSLKGPLVDISFLDLGGNIINSENEFSGGGGSTTATTYSRTKSNTTATSGSSNNELGELDDDDDDIDLAALSAASANISNSIAENFYSSSATTNNNNTTNTTTGKEASTNNSTITANSSNSEFTTFSSNNFDNETAAQPSPHASSNAFMTSFGGPPDDPPPPTTTKSSNNKTNKKALSATKSSKADFGVTQDPGGGGGGAVVTVVSDKSSFAVLTSERQIKVIGLPSQSCLFKQKISDGAVSKANVTTVNNLCYLTCYMSNGTFLVYNLPNPTLKASVLLNAPPVGYKDKELMDRAMRSFAFGGNGHAIYMCSPSELQKVYLSTASGEQGSHVNLTDMLPEFFDPKVVAPLAPKPNLFKSLFSSTPFDREELFGESSGKPSISIIKSVDGEVIKTKKELTELQKLALERGEKLNALQMKTEEMTMAASAFAKNAHDLANKYKEKSKRFGF